METVLLLNKETILKIEIVTFPAFQNLHELCIGQLLESKSIQLAEKLIITPIQ